MMIRKALLTAAMLAIPVCASAQNDFGVWVNAPQFKSSSETAISGETVKLKFDQKIGYGISWNHFSGLNMSTEFAAHQLRADAKASLHSTVPPLDVSAKLGTLKVNQFSAVMKWHFMPRSFITPYIGAGAAYFTGGQIKTVNNPSIGETGQTFKFANRFGYIANAGVNFAVTRSIAIGLDARYSPYTARDKSDPNPTTNSVKLDPTTIALGVRFRM
jgi:outer membrane protein W